MDRDNGNSLIPGSRPSGRLTIFVGASPGSGKTFGMLRAAHEELKKGRRVLLVDAAKRSDMETSELYGLFERYKPTNGAPELVDVLNRSPELVMIENLGSRNPVGSRNRFRWADVLELLEDGVDVYSTLAAWQVEGIANAVEKRTGMRPIDVVPNEALMLASEVLPVIAEPETVLRRLESRDDLLPLEESLCTDLKGDLSFYKFLVEQVELLGRQEEQDDAPAEPAARRLALVCVGPTPTAVQVLRQAYEASTRMKLRLVALIVEGGGPFEWTSERQRYADEAMQLAQIYGVEVITATGTGRISATILKTAAERKPEVIFLGAPRNEPGSKRARKSIASIVAGSAGSYSVHLLTTEAHKDTVRTMTVASTRGESGWWGPYSFAVSMSALCALLAISLGPEVAPLPKLLVFILGVAVVARRTGLGESIVAIVLSLVLFDLVALRFSEEEFSAQTYFWAMTGGAVVMSVIVYLQIGLKLSLKRVGQRERHLSILQGFTQEIADAGNLDELGELAGGYIEQQMDAECAITAYRDDTDVELYSSKSGFEHDPLEVEAAEEARATAQMTGASSRVMANRRGTYIPISDREGLRGMLSIKCPEGDELNPDAVALLRSFAWQLALAFDRLYLAKERERALLRMERQQIQNTLLSSVSHDLRSPLTVISGAATSLIRPDGDYDAEVTSELASTIRDEAERLNQLVQNLLDITRLKSGQIKVNREWCSIEEIVGSVIQIAQRQLTNRELCPDVPFDLPLIQGDSVLLQQMILNLVENAGKYTPEGSSIGIKSWVEGDDLMVSVTDEGPGIPEGMEERIFEKFERGGSKGLPQGSGLGLAICRAIAEIHDGSIVARNRSGGGAEFLVRLPVADQPELPEE